MMAPSGAIIAFATAPGSVASDGGRSKNGVYTKYLMKHMKTPGLSIERVLKNTRIDVAKETENKQIPWEHSSLMGDFCFADSNGTDVVTPQPQKPGETKLTVESNVGHAMVAVNGRGYGKVPQKFTITEAGNYRIRVTAEGYQPYEKSFRLGPGQSRTVTAYLEKEEEEPPEPEPFTNNSLGMKFVYIPPGACIAISEVSGCRLKNSVFRLIV